MNKEKTNKSTIQQKLIIATFFLLIASLAFNAMLSLGFIEKLYVDAVTSKYFVTGKDLQLNLNNSLRFGKTLENFVAADNILLNAKKNMLYGLTPEDRLTNQSAVNIFVSLPDGLVLYSIDKSIIGTTINGENLSFRKKDENSQYIKHGNLYVIPLPLKNISRKTVGTVNISFDQKLLDHLFAEVLKKSAGVVSIIVLCCTGLLIFILQKIKLHKKNKNKIAFIIICVIGCSQLVFTGFNTYSFKNYYVELTREKTLDIVNMLKEDIEYLIDKGVKIEKLTKMDAIINEIVGFSPELEKISILNIDSKPLYLSQSQRKAGGNETKTVSSKHMVRADIFNHGVLSGYVSAEISMNELWEKLKEIVFESITVFVISVLFLFEMLVLTFKYIEKKIYRKKENAPVDFGIMRPAVFIFLFGVDICISFLPLYMAEFDTAFLNFSKDIIIGLPVSVEVTFAGIAIIFSGRWFDKRGWHEPFITGLLMVGCGYIYSWLSPSAVHLILSRAFVGFGYGLALMAGQGFIITNCNKNNRTLGLADFFAGVYAGSICGSAVGAILAERLGYAPVFFIGAILVFIVVAYTMFFMRKAMIRPEPLKNIEDKELEKKSLKEFMVLLFKLIFNRNIFSLIILSSIPYALAVVGFLNYFCPVYLNRIGAPQSNIGRIYLVYGMCLIYIAPFISKFIKPTDEKNSLVLSGILGASGFLVFAFFGGIYAAAVTVFLLGLAGSFGAPRRSYILKFKETHDIGEGTAMGVFLSSIRIGQMLGPIMFGWLIVNLDISKGIPYFGLVYLIATIVFLFVVENDKKIDVMES